MGCVLSNWPRHRFPPTGLPGRRRWPRLGIWSGKTTEQAGPVVARAPGGPFPAGREPFPNWNLTAGRHSVLRQPRSLHQGKGRHHRQRVRQGRRRRCDPAVGHIHRLTRGRLQREDRQQQPGNPRRLALHLPAQRARRHVRASRRAGPAWVDDRQRQGVDAELRRRGERPVGLLRPRPVDAAVRVCPAMGRRPRLRRRLTVSSSAPVGGAIEMIGHGAVVVEHHEAVEAA